MDEDWVKGDGDTDTSTWVFWVGTNIYSGFRTAVNKVWQWWLLPTYPTKMDTLGTLLMGWLAFGLILTLIAKFLYSKFLSDTSDDLSEESELPPKRNGTSKRRADGGAEAAKPIVRKKSKLVPEGVFQRIPAPLATGGDPDAVRWANNVLVWFYEGSDGGKILKDTWNDVLNEYTVAAALETGVLVEVLEVLPQSPQPKLTNVIIDCSPIDDMTFTCDLEATLYLLVRTTRTQREVTTESEYACAVRPLRGRLNVSILTKACAGTLKLDGWPEVTLDVDGVRNNSEGLDEEQLQEVLKEVLTNALRNMVLDLDFIGNKSFPRFRRVRQTPDPVIPIGYDSLAASNQSSASSAVGIPGLTGKRLLVKVVKATAIGGDKVVQHSYVVVEMDDPPQKFTTSVVNEESSPFWDEQFLFDLSENTLELLFEIYEKERNRFLGLGIVGIEELVATPSQRQIIPLQPRPYEKDQVTGSLTCEFLFLDRADLPDVTFRGSSRSRSNPTTTSRTYTKTVSDRISSEEELPVGTNDVTAAALRDLEEKQSLSSQNQHQTKSTLIIHSSRKPLEDPRYENPSAFGRVASSVPPGVGQRTSSGSPSVVNNHAFDPSVIATQTDDRGRSRNRRKDFFGSLKKRFSRSKVRSQSSDQSGRGPSLDHDPLAGRSISVERSTTLSRNRGSSNYRRLIRNQPLLSVPLGANRSATAVPGETSSTRSSLSGASGLSSTSTKTFIHEASLLVVETLENGVVKHYLVPLSLQRRHKWRKKGGIKLHIYNEHTFVAKHLSHSTECQVCSKHLSRRLGKQGYECRDCAFKCHKPCHIKADVACPNSNFRSMDLVLCEGRGIANP